MLNLYYFSITCLYLTCTIAHACDLGVVGQTYPILETDFLEFLQNRLNVMRDNGELTTIENKFRDNVNKHADRPLSFSGISKTTGNKSWLIDPSITTPYDLTDEKGHIFAKAGTKVNPLSLVTLHSAMVFIDADDAHQVTWMQRIILSNNKKIKIVLVNGSISAMAKRFLQPIYFDQESRLTARFNIKHVPAIVSQHGMLLKVAEVAI